MEYMGTFIITLLDDNGEPGKELGQITGVMIPVGEPNPSRTFRGDANQQFMDFIDQSPSELRLRIADIKQVMPTLGGRWTVKHGGGSKVEIKSQGKITSPSQAK